MKEQTKQVLNQINTDFYAQVGEQFHRTRHGGWPGWNELLTLLPAKKLRVLDIGCGNGRFATYLMEAGYIVKYVGVDTSAYLLDQAATIPGARTLNIDITSKKFDAYLDNCQPFDLIVVFGVMHHLPSKQLRMRILQKLGEKLSAGGLLVATFWQYAQDARFQKKEVTYTDVLKLYDNLDIEDLEEGDGFITWHNNPAWIRYVHTFSDQEFESYADQLSLKEVMQYEADGKSGGLNRYFVWQR